MVKKPCWARTNNNHFPVIAYIFVFRKLYSIFCIFFIIVNRYFKVYLYCLLPCINRAFYYCYMLYIIRLNLHKLCNVGSK